MSHTYIVGATGSGKSTLIKALLPERGFCLIDKHGSLAQEVADSRRCIYWRPADLDYPVGLNPLQNVPIDQRWKVTADIVSIFSDVWKLGPETPRLLYFLRAGVRLLLDTPGSTLLDLRRLLSDADFRTSLLRRSTDAETRQTWAEFNAKQPKDQTHEIASLQNKVAALADPLPLRYVLGQGTTLSIPKVLAKGEILVADLSDLGDEPSALIGAFLINSIKQAAQQAYAAALNPEEPGDREVRQLQPYCLIIDEFQSFGTQTIATILSEARKWNLSLTVAHQFLSQLDEEIRDAILGNCSTIYSFRISAKDAKIIAEELDIKPESLIALPLGRYHYSKLSTIRGVRGVPHGGIADTSPVELPKGFLEGNREWQRSKLSRPRKDVERDLKRSPRKRSRRRW